MTLPSKPHLFARSHGTFSILFFTFFLFGIACCCCLSLIDPFIESSNRIESLQRTVANADSNWLLVSSDLLSAGDCQTARNDLEKANKEKGLYRLDITSHLYASASNLEATHFDVEYTGSTSPFSCSLITLTSFCDGNTSSEGMLYTIPLKIMFVSKGCDIHDYRGPDGSAYIPKSLADKIIEGNPALHGYSDIIGTSISLAKSRHYNVANIYYEDSGLAPFWNTRYGHFLITNDYAFMNEQGFACAFAFQNGSTNYRDVLSFVQLTKHNAVEARYLKNKTFIGDADTAFIESSIKTGRLRFVPSPLSLVLVFFSFALTCFLYISSFTKEPHIIWIQIVSVTLTLGILLAINVLNLFFINQTALLNVLNYGLSLYCVLVLLLCALVFFKKRVALPFLRRRRNDVFDI